MCRIFNGVNKPLKHSRDFLCLIYKRGHFFGSYFIELCGDIDLCSKFRNRAFCNVKELNKFLFGLTFRAFSNIGWYGYRRTGNLIRKTKVFGIFKSLINRNRQLAASLPYFQLFKIFAHHLNIQYFPTLSTGAIATFPTLSTFNFQLERQRL